MSIRRSAKSKKIAVESAVRDALKGAAKEVAKANTQVLARRVNPYWILGAGLVTVGVCWAYTAKRGEA